MIDSGPIAEAKFKVSQTDTTVRISRDVIEHPTPQMAATFHLEPGKAVQRTLITEAIAPSLSVITNIFTFPDQPERPAHILISPQGVTPANDRKCLNFLVLSSSYQDEQPPQAWDALWHLFGQDKVVLEQVQRRFDEPGGWELPEISVKADSAALNFRRKMATMAEEERSARSLLRASAERAA
jgi:Vanillate O-demethylase oxygenase C-terminal domain